MASVKIQRMRYQNNKLSYYLILLGLIFNIVCMVAVYRNKGNEPTLSLGLDVVINIIVMLAAFLTAEKNKIYNLQWGFIAIALGIANILRILFIPLMFLLKKNLVFMFAKDANGKIMFNSFFSSFSYYSLLLIISGILIIIAGIITINKHKKLNEYLKEVGGVK